MRNTFVMKTIDLTEEQIDTASLKDLRRAYRELLAETTTLRALISERTCAAVNDLREKGLKFNGNLPYGLECDADTRKLKASRYEKRLIAEITKLKAEGRSLRDIARTLTERNYVNRRGNPIDAKQVSRILDAAGVKISDVG
jgi:DNA invertase Pin-like site-specific DNA recombinase